MTKHERYNRSEKGRARSRSYNQSTAGWVRKRRYVLGLRREVIVHQLKELTEDGSD